SDPGITIVELFAVLTESLLYRANRVPAQNRLKFLQLLGVPLQSAAAASGIVEIRHDRGPLAALTLDRGGVLSAGDVEVLTRDPMTVLPVAARLYVKRTVSEDDPRFAEFEARYEAVRAAAQAAADAGSEAPPTVKLTFYEPEALPLPTRGVPNPAFDLANTI